MSRQRFRVRVLGLNVDNYAVHPSGAASGGGCCTLVVQEHNPVCPA
jgi:hypothetical protein